MSQACGWFSVMKGRRLHSLMYSPAIAGPHHTPPHASQAGKAPHEASGVEHNSFSDTKRNEHSAEWPPDCSIASLLCPRRGRISVEQYHICRRREHNLHFICAAPGDGAQIATESRESAPWSSRKNCKVLIAQLKCSVSTLEILAYLTRGHHH